MMEQSRREAMRIYLETEIARCRSREKELMADEREDESVFMKVQGNVFEIFHTIFSTALRLSGEDNEKVSQFFLAKTEQIPENWRTALIKAEAHGDLEAAHLEKIKLETAGEVRSTFEKIWEGKG